MMRFNQARTKAVHAYQLKLLQLFTFNPNQTSKAITVGTHTYST